MSQAQNRSILAVDFGSANTRALLFELVDGEYRLLAQDSAPTTIGSPYDDVHVGLSAVLRKIRQASNRRFLDDSGRLIKPEQSDGVGIDCFVATTSAGTPLRTLLVGLYPQVDIAAARRAIAPFYLEAVAEVHLEDGLGPKGRLNRIVHSRPQLIVITGGTDDGARSALLAMLSLVRQAVALMRLGDRPAILYAGNQSLKQSAREMLSQQTEVLFAPNIRGKDGLALEPAQALLARHFDERKRASKSFQRVAAAADSGIASTARAIETMTVFFSRASECDVLALDFGSARALLAHARRGAVQTAIRNDLGLGQSAARALELIGEDAVARWLPFHPRKGELEQYAQNKVLRSGSVPLDMRERCIEYALLRAGIRFMLHELSAGNRSRTDWSRVGLVLVAGAAITGSGQGALDMLLLADALDSDGVVQVKSDAHGALAALGGLAAVEPLAVVQLANGSALEHVGALIRVSGRAAVGATALKIKAKIDQGQSFSRELAVGDVWHLPAPAGTTVELRIQARRGLSIGGRRRLRLRLAGGRGGFLFDARLDSLATGSVSERAVKMLRWFAAVTGQEHPVAIPEDWLAAPRISSVARPPLRFDFARRACSIWK